MKRLIIVFLTFYFISNLFALDLSANGIHLISDSKGSSDAYLISIFHKSIWQDSGLLFGGNYANLKSDTIFLDGNLSTGNFIYSFFSPSGNINFKACFADSEKIKLKIPATNSLIDCLDENNLNVLSDNLRKGMSITLRNYSSNHIVMEIPIKISELTVTPYCSFSNFSVNDADLYFLREKINADKNFSTGVEFNSGNNELKFKYNNLSLQLENSIGKPQISGSANIFFLNYNYNFMLKNNSSLKLGMQYLLFDEKCIGRENIVDAGMRFMLKQYNIQIKNIDIEQKLRCSFLNETIAFILKYNRIDLKIYLNNYFLFGVNDFLSVEDDSESKYISIKDENTIKKEMNCSGILFADFDSTFYLNKRKSAMINMKKCFVIPYQFKYKLQESYFDIYDISLVDYLLSGLALQFKICF